ncbi:MAG: hypothetical protein PHV78_00200 [Patescibacteria group bacterium]|nr:hypothetical protein [Patescibacteria group bacterium]MDD5121403.1 hypothetical protein [Patescibacteria group bacterium]MDD5221871.1 hypothetical protein [Patescibacteria group bacterium]MDD5395678.1 hypothetical protein [Patescibacteria group bacterium]
MNTIATQNLIRQIHELWIMPEVARRNFTDPIYAILIIFRPEKTEIRLNGETELKITIDPSVGGPLVPGAPITAQELAKHKIKNISVPEEIFDNFGFIAVVTINKYWTIYFNFIPNKKNACEKIRLAEDFIKSAKAVSTEKVKAYNLFQALEQALHATLFKNPLQGNNIKGAKTHGATQSLVNIEAKNNNIPRELSNLFNQLLSNRSQIYKFSPTSIIATKENIDLVERYIMQLKTGLFQDNL